jgi:hypothetical protein
LLYPQELTGGIVYILTIHAEKGASPSQILSVDVISKKLLDKARSIAIIGGNGELVVDVGSIKSILRLINEESERNFSKIGNGLVEEWCKQTPTSTSIQYVEFMAYLILCSKGSPKKKLSLLFHLLDYSNEGKISVEAITWLYFTIYSVSGKERHAEYVNSQVETAIDTLVSKKFVQQQYPLYLKESDLQFVSTQGTFYLGETLAEFLDAFDLKVNSLLSD